MAVDSDLILGWIMARSVARALPAPVGEAGGWRIDTRSEQEWARYVFAEPSPGLRELGKQIDQPRIFLKLCADSAVLRAMMPVRWSLLPPSWVMTGPDIVAERPLSAGYDAVIDETGGVLHIRITAPDSALAASGYAAEHANVFVYDRIVVTPEHQRRGLGSVVMASLGSRRRSAQSRRVLVATDEGRALYASLGWQVHAPYASAVIPDPAP